MVKSHRIESQGRVVKEYRSAYPDPLFLKKGEAVSIERKKTDWEGWLWCTKKMGKRGWVPEAYLETDGTDWKSLRDYDGTELTVEVGIRLAVLEEESGWFWCRTEKGMFGWVPKENVKIGV